MVQTIPSHTSSICSTGETPMILSGALLMTIRELWSNADNITHESLKDFVWTEDVRTSKIWINMARRWDARVVQNRPAIVLKRNNVSYHTVTVGDLTHGGLDLSDGGADRYTRVATGSHTAFCLSIQSGEAELLATETHRFLQSFAPMFRQEFNLLRLEVDQLGAIGRLKESNQHFAVPIQIVWAYNEVWKLAPEAPVLKQVALSAAKELYRGD